MIYDTSKDLVAVDMSKLPAAPWKVDFPYRDMNDWHPQSSPCVLDAHDCHIFQQKVFHPGELDEAKLAVCYLTCASFDMYQTLKALLPVLVEKGLVSEANEVAAVLAKAENR